VRVVADPSVAQSIQAFVAARDWDQFHTPANLAKSIVIEAGELLECFQWSDEADPKAVAAELADVLTYCYLLGAKLGLDLDQIVLDKLAVSAEKYPIAKARGRSARYEQLPD
jgi:dCTP diphosphatase